MTVSESLPVHPAPTVPLSTHAAVLTIRQTVEPRPYDALLIVAFGGPEHQDQVIPFLENVLRGRDVPRARLEEVAHHYRLFGGVSPHNAQIRALLAALEAEFAARGPRLPIYWGNRNWAPYLADTLGQMVAAGVQRALCFFVSAYSSYSSCRQYREDLAAAQAAVGPTAPHLEKIRAFYNHPGFVEPNVELLQRALMELSPTQRAAARVVFTAHSIPRAMAQQCDYEAQLLETCRLVAQGAGLAPDRWQLVYQSRSGAPQQPWLEPDICAHLEVLHGDGVEHVVVAPIGFLSDHLEVIYDLDTEARAVAQRLGLQMVRAATVGTHPRFIRMVRELIEERMSAHPERPALGERGPNHDVCPHDCCLSGRPGPIRPAAAGQPNA